MPEKIRSKAFSRPHYVARLIQHLYTCFNEKLYGFLIAGAIFFPIAVVHGWGIWLGWWH